MTRTPEKKRKNSSPGAIGITEQEDLDRSLKELDREKSIIIQTQKRHKSNKNDAITSEDEKEVFIKTITQKRSTTKTRIDAIKTARAQILEATNRMSGGKIQFNRQDQISVQTQIEIMTSNLIFLLENINKTNTSGTDTQETWKSEIKKMKEENRKQAQDLKNNYKTRRKVR